MYNTQKFKNNPKVSVIVPAYNAAKTLPSCLESLMKLDFPIEEREIIVVDNNSTDNTKEIIVRYPVRYIFEAKKTRGAARNRGIGIAKGKYIAFTDSDCVVEKNWLKELVRNIEDSDGVAAIGGKITAYRLDNVFEKYAERREILGQGLAIDPDITQSIPRIVTANAIFRRDILEEVGLFDEDMITSEDTEIGWRLSFSGYKMKYVPEAIVYHKYIRNLKDFCLHQFEYGCAAWFINLKYRSVFCRHSNEFKYFCYKIIKLCLLIDCFLKSIFIKNRQERIYSFLDYLGKIFFVFGNLYLSLKPVRLSDRLESKRKSLNKKFYINYNGYKLTLSNNIVWFLGNDSLRLLNFKNYSYYSFNDIATSFWLKWSRGKDLSRTIEETSAEYGVSEELVRNDLVDFINQLTEENILIKK